MTELLTDWQVANHETEEAEEMGSHNHSAIQANVTYLLKRTGKYSVYTELSLDTTPLDPKQFKFKDEIKPDVCVYPKRGLIRPFDLLKMSEMPLLVVEVLSPRQSAYEILEKDYFDNAVAGYNVMIIDATKNMVHADNKKLVLLQGLEDFIVVDTKDVLLICKKDKEQEPSVTAPADIVYVTDDDDTTEPFYS
jgi:Uma2 family endonuclease